jgi:hypothetical protein
MKKTLIAALCGIALLSGCATGDEYRQYAEAQKSMANARAMSEAARYQALAEIAKSGDTAAKVAAVMTLQQGGPGQPQQNHQIGMPESWSDKALRWAQVIVPTATQTLTAVYTVKKQTDLAMAQSNNAAATAASTNSTFASMNTNMANSNTSIAAAGFNAVTTVANSGLAATTTTAANGMTGITTVANNGLTAVTNVAGAGLTAVTGVAGVGFTAVTGVANSGLATAVAINASSNTAITAVSAASNASIQAISSQLSHLQPNITTTTTSTSTTTNSCGANTSGGTLTCP